MGVHDGHREKMKQRYRTGGLESFADHEVLELLLFFAIPRRDTNSLGHQLINRFGSLSGVLTASAEELEQVEGVGANAAMLMSLFADTNKRLRLEPEGKEWILNSVDTAGTYLLELYRGIHTEVAYQLCLDRKGKLIATRRLAEGNFGSANVDVRILLSNALNTGACGIILAHNHPSGIAIPSREDILSTEKMHIALATVGVTLIDHLVVAEDDFVSMADSGLISPLT